MATPAFKDHVDGAESDSGYAVGIICGKCKKEHQVTVSKIGWFAFTCTGIHHFGCIDDWRTKAAGTQ